jgi:hypothetical protein
LYTQLPLQQEESQGQVFHHQKKARVRRKPGSGLSSSHLIVPSFRSVHSKEPGRVGFTLRPDENRVGHDIEAAR